MMRSRKGFTLMEILVAVSILGIVLAMAVPNYTRSVAESRANEAKTNLKLIHAAQQIYKANKGVYWAGGPAMSAVNAGLGLSLNASTYNLYTVTATAGTSFSASTTAVGRTYTINEAGTITQS